MNRIYADYAATTPISETALAAMCECMNRCYGNPSSLHEEGRNAARRLKEIRAQIAGCIGAEPDEIYFTSGGTEADNQALVTGAARGSACGKKHMILSAIEHHAVLNRIPELERQGFEITLLQPDGEGRISVEELMRACREDTIMVSVMYVNNEVGTVQPIAEIGQFCAERGILFHTDAVAATGHLPIDVKESRIGMLSFSGHKFCGPRGIGVLYAERGIEPANLMYGGNQERGKRPGTTNVAAAAGMAAALSECVSGMEERNRILEQRRERLLSQVREIEGIRLNGSDRNRVPGIMNFGLGNVSGEAMMLLMDLDGIAVSTGAACNAGDVRPSHVLTAMGLSEDEARSCVRISISEQVSEEEIDMIAESLKNAVDRIRNSANG